MTPKLPSIQGIKIFSRAPECRGKNEFDFNASGAPDGAPRKAASRGSCSFHPPLPFAVPPLAAAAADGRGSICDSPKSLSLEKKKKKMPWTLGCVQRNDGARGQIVGAKASASQHLHVPPDRFFIFIVLVARVVHGGATSQTTHYCRSREIDSCQN